MNSLTHLSFTLILRPLFYPYGTLLAQKVQTVFKLASEEGYSPLYRCTRHPGRTLPTLL